MHELWRSWGFEPGILIGLTITIGLYALGLWKLWRSAGIGHGIRRWEAWCYAGGCFTLFVALVSPIHPLGEVLFSAHMVQHELLMLVAAPLLVLGRPMIACLRALSASLASTLGRSSNLPAWKWFWGLLSAAGISLVDPLHHLMGLACPRTIPGDANLRMGSRRPAHLLHRRRAAVLVVDLPWASRSEKLRHRRALTLHHRHSQRIAGRTPHLLAHHLVSRLRRHPILEPHRSGRPTTRRSDHVGPRMHSLYRGCIGSVREMAQPTRDHTGLKQALSAIPK